MCRDALNLVSHNRTQSLEVALHINVERNKQNAINYLTYLMK